MGIKDQVAFAGGNAEAWSHPSTIYNDAEGTISVDTGQVSGALNDAVYSSQRTLLTRMRGWHLTSEGGVDTFTTPQQVAKRKAAEESKANAEMLGKLRRDLPKDASSLWKTEAAVKPDSDGNPMIHLDMIAYEDQPFLTDRVWRDSNHLNKC